LIPFEILYEDNHLIAINKTNHDLVQKDITGDDALVDKVKEYIKHKYAKPGNVFLGVTHRLDRPVSGIVLFARTSKALSRMNELFREGTIKKKYWAIVKEQPPKTSDTLVHYLVKNSKQNKSYCYDKEINNAKRAELDYTILGSSDNYHLLEIDLKTGRHHQIRAQLAAIGSPIRGDLKYGFPRSNTDGGISLHSRSVSFVHPVSKEEILLIADPPKEEALWTFFMKTLGLMN
jgi:23S rRNA pseudouridine1911/1915/1917 synthase